MVLKEMDDATRELSLNNPALWLAEMWNSEGNGKGDRNMVVLPYKDALRITWTLFATTHYGIHRKERRLGW